MIRLTYTMIDTYCASYAGFPRAVTPDIDDTVDVVHGHQQLSLFNAHHDERCFTPIHVYDTATARPIAILLRPGKTPSGAEARRHVRRLVRRIRSHWPHTRLTVHGDGHYGHPEVMAWCEQNTVDYIFGLPGNTVLNRLLDPAADDVRTRRAETQAPVLRRYAELRYGAKFWGCERRVAARIEATTLGLDLRCVVTNLRSGSAEWLYNTLYCARGQAENLVELHKGQLASDRSNRPSALANQVRLVLHTAAYWLMLTVRDAIPSRSRSPRPSSRRSGGTCSRSPGVSPKPPHASASPSPQHALKPTCSPESHAACSSPSHNSWGNCPRPRLITSPPAPSTADQIATKRRKAEPRPPIRPRSIRTR